MLGSYGVGLRMISSSTRGDTYDKAFLMLGIHFIDDPVTSNAIAIASRVGTLEFGDIRFKERVLG